MIFTEIQEVHRKLTGWCSWQKAETLAAIVLAHRPTISVEIGVWAGKSFIPMAMAHRHIGHGTIWGVDPWKNDDSKAGQVNPADQEWWSHQGNHDYAHSEFSKKIVELGLQNVSKIVAKKSDAVDPPEAIGLLHIDGNHGEQSIRDVRRFCANVLHGGILVLDDLEWSGGSVMQSVNLAITLGFVELFRVKDSETQNYWAVFQKLR